MYLVLLISGNDLQALRLFVMANALGLQLFRKF
jgi:hypothetical protein